MITGRQAFNSIEEATAKVRADEMRLNSALRSASEETARLRQDRLKELRALAQLKFGLIKSGDLVHDLDAAEQQVKDLLDRIARQISEAESRRQEAAHALQKAEAIQRERASAYDAAAGALRARENEIAPSVTSDPAWIALKARFDAASNTADEAEKKAAQAEAGRARKKTPYKSNSLFMYLWRRKLGTPDYSSGFFVRYFDEKIAALINYREARANYAMLNQIPNRLRAHADRLAAERETERQKLGAFEQGCLIEAGGGPLQKKAVEAKAALDASEAEVAEVGKSWRRSTGNMMQSHTRTTMVPSPRRSSLLRRTIRAMMCVRSIARLRARRRTKTVLSSKRSTGLRNRSAGPTRKSRGYGGKFARSRQGGSKSSRRGGNSASTAMTTRAPPSATRRRSTMCLAASSKVR